VGHRFSLKTKVVSRIYRVGPVWVTGLALFLCFSLNPSHTVPERFWIINVGEVIVAVGVIWHLSLIVTTARPRWEMVLYAVLNLPPLYFLTMLYAEVIALGHRYWEAPM